VYLSFLGGWAFWVCIFLSLLAFKERMTSGGEERKGGCFGMAGVSILGLGVLEGRRLGTQARGNPLPSLRRWWNLFTHIHAWLFNCDASLGWQFASVVLSCLWLSPTGSVLFSYDHPIKFIPSVNKHLHLPRLPDPTMTCSSIFHSKRMQTRRRSIPIRCISICKEECPLPRLRL
jgi:hypothetical protein